MELADVIAGRAAGRRSDDEVLLCLNPAYGVIDAAVAAYVYRRALATGVGTELPA